jgi:hypothetical protein
MGAQVLESPAPRRTRWKKPRQLLPPANAGPVPQEYFISSLACPKTGSCVAVGDYNDGKNLEHAAITTESAGRWQRAREIHPPAGALSYAFASLLSVTCDGPGSCLTVGWYSDIAQAMTLAETGGRWCVRSG